MPGKQLPKSSYKKKSTYKKKSSYKKKTNRKKTRKRPRGLYKKSFSKRGGDGDKLSATQLKIFRTALKIEKDKVIELLKGDDYDFDFDPHANEDLYRLQNDEAAAEKAKDIFKKLLREGFTGKTLQNTLKMENKDFKKNYDNEKMSDAEDLMKDAFTLNHINFTWTKHMIRDANHEEKKLNKSLSRLAFAKSSDKRLGKDSNVKLREGELLEDIVSNMQPVSKSKKKKSSS